MIVQSLMKCERLSGGMYRKHHSKGPGTAVLESNKSVELIHRTGRKVSGRKSEINFKVFECPEDVTLNNCKITVCLPLSKLKYENIILREEKKKCIFFNIFTLLKLLSC